MANTAGHTVTPTKTTKWYRAVRPIVMEVSALLGGNSRRVLYGRSILWQGFEIQDPPSG